jgi:uncharacterized protein
MKLFRGIELIDLAIYTHKTLIFSDFHIGYEEALNKQGTLIPRFQFEEIIKRLDNIFLKLKKKKIERVILNGDLKHEFGTISEQEWRHTLRLLDYFGQHCNEIILIKGNHDTILGPIARKRNVKIVDYYLFSPIIRNSLEKNSIDNKNKLLKNKYFRSDILVIHGDKLPDNELLKCISTIITGHEHPAVSVREGPRSELFKAYLIGKWKDKNLIVQPSFNLVTEGTDITKEKPLSPFLKGNLEYFDAVITADKLYIFGKIKDI